MIIVGIGLAGFAGAVFRCWLGDCLAQKFGTPFPWGTFVINISGSLLLGFLVGVNLGGDRIPAPWQIIVATGFLGSFTTFSTWKLETFRLLKRGSFFLAGTNIGLSTAAGLLAAGAGIFVGRHF